MHNRKKQVFLSLKFTTFRFRPSLPGPHCIRLVNIMDGEARRSWSSDPIYVTSWDKCLSVSGAANKRPSLSEDWSPRHLQRSSGTNLEGNQLHAEGISRARVSSIFAYDVMLWPCGCCPYKCSILRWVCLSACHLVVSSTWNCLKLFSTGLNQRNLNNPLTIQHVVNIRLLVNRITAGHSSLLILIVSRSAVAWVHDSFLMVGFRKLFWWSHVVLWCWCYFLWWLVLNFSWLHHQVSSLFPTLRFHCDPCESSLVKAVIRSYYRLRSRTQSLHFCIPTPTKYPLILFVVRTCFTCTSPIKSWFNFASLSHPKPSTLYHSPRNRVFFSPMVHLPDRAC